MKLLKSRIATSLVVFLTLLTTAEMATVVIAQQDPANPAPLNINRQAQNSWSSDRPTNFYYTFLAGAGEVRITLDAKTSGPGGETVSVALLNQDFNPVTPATAKT